MNIGTTLTNKKNGNMAKITAIAENGLITILENDKERTITKKTLTNYYRVVAEAEPANVETTTELPEETKVINFEPKKMKEVKPKSAKPEIKTSTVDGLEALRHKVIVLGLTLKQTDSDAKKSKVSIWYEDSKKSICDVVYKRRAADLYNVRSRTEFTGSEYHEKWAKCDCYDKKNLTLDEVFAITQELLNK